MTRLRLKRGLKFIFVKRAKPFRCKDCGKVVRNYKDITIKRGYCCLCWNNRK